MLNIIGEFAWQDLTHGCPLCRRGIFRARPWNTMRAEARAPSGIDAVDIYGFSEVMAPGMASECMEAKDGPVIWKDHFYPEIIDPITGEVLPDRSDGKLVFTSLTKEALQ